jgi:hypothetical protein
MSGNRIWTSLGETSFGGIWQVEGSNGENRLFATGASQGEGRHRATLQAREMALLATPREEESQ